MTQPTLKHATIGCVRYSVNVWRYFVSFLPSVHVDNFFSVNGQTFVRIHNDTKKT